ncbi:carbohydrate porin [Ferriphaselus sp. R-1]|uniref:carbohydrate porin n=1 Tax=Ferriphaselus sp. R-1 TaxID=1485544 RepID=UPI000557FA75|nr:carbohydrate porin [Ferriphaselus sp. R-1]
MKPYLLLSLALCAPLNAVAASDEELRALRDELKQLKENYQQRLEQLESRLQQAELRAAEPPVAAPVAQVRNEPAASASAYNPAISLILAGNYGNLQRAPAIPPTGFAMSAHSPAAQGFNLGESELGFSASIDPRFRGVATLALGAAGGVSVENAFVDTTALGNGVKLRIGRFFSGLGYLNEVHAHAWDFVDQPLVYRALWNNQLGEDGVQLKWLAPTDTFVELGAELGRGRGFPGSDRAKNGSGAGVLFAHVGGDVGVSHNWRVGASLHQTGQSDWQSVGVPDLLGTPGGVTDAFTGDVRTGGLDFVWKYAPEGNSSSTSLKLQGEYFRRQQSGLLSYNLATTDSYALTQSGWYLQGVYKFLPEWRVGLRYDQLDPGTATVGALNAANVISSYGYTPRRTSVMFDYSPSEFSRLRLQLARDQSRQALPDNQLFLQYLMSLGAHGAHGY